VRPFLKTCAFGDDGILRETIPATGAVLPAHASLNLTQRRTALRAKKVPLNVDGLVDKWIARSSYLMVQATLDKAAYHHDCFYELPVKRAILSVYTHISEIDVFLQQVLYNAPPPYAVPPMERRFYDTTPGFDFTMDSSALPLYINSVKYIHKMRLYLERVTSGWNDEYGSYNYRNNLGKRHWPNQQPHSDLPYHFQKRDATAKVVIANWYCLYEYVRPLLFHLSVIREHAKIIKSEWESEEKYNYSTEKVKHSIHRTRKLTEEETAFLERYKLKKAVSRQEDKQFALEKKLTASAKKKTNDYCHFALWDFDRRQIHEGSKDLYVQWWERRNRQTMFIESEELPPPAPPTLIPIDATPVTPFSKPKKKFVIDNTIHPLDPEQEDDEAESLMEEMEQYGQIATKIAYRVLKQYLLLKLKSLVRRTTASLLWAEALYIVRTAQNISGAEDPVDEFVYEKIEGYFRCLNPFKGCQPEERDDFEDDEDEIEEEPEPLEPEMGEGPPTPEDLAAEDAAWAARKTHRHRPNCGPPKNLPVVVLPVPQTSV
jgi:hypothetical protein